MWDFVIVFWKKKSGQKHLLKGECFFSTKVEGGKQIKGVGGGKTQSWVFFLLVL